MNSKTIVFTLLFSFTASIASAQIKICNEIMRANLKDGTFVHNKASGNYERLSDMCDKWEKSRGGSVRFRYGMTSGGANFNENEMRELCRFVSSRQSYDKEYLERASRLSSNLVDAYKSCLQSIRNENSIRDLYEEEASIGAIQPPGPYNAAGDKLLEYFYQTFFYTLKWSPTGRPNAQTVLTFDGSIFGPGRDAQGNDRPSPGICKMHVNGVRVWERREVSLRSGQLINISCVAVQASCSAPVLEVRTTEFIRKVNFTRILIRGKSTCTR